MNACLRFYQFCKSITKYYIVKGENTKGVSTPVADMWRREKITRASCASQGAASTWRYSIVNFNVFPRLFTRCNTPGKNSHQVQMHLWHLDVCRPCLQDLPDLGLKTAGSPLPILTCKRISSWTRLFETHWNSLFASLASFGSNISYLQYKIYRRTKTL